MCALKTSDEIFFVEKTNERKTQKVIESFIFIYDIDNSY